MSTEQPDVSAAVPARIRPGRVVLGILILLIPIAGLAAWAMSPRTPEVSAALMIEDPVMTPGLASAQPPLTNDALNRRTAGVVASILDEGLLRETLKDSEVRDTAWYRNEPDKNRLLDTLTHRLKVRAIPDTGIITVSFRTEEPREAAQIVNTIVKRYLDRVQRNRREVYSNRLAALTRHESELKRLAQQIHSQKEAFITYSLSTPGITTGVNPLADVIRYLAVEGARLDIEVSRLKIALNRMRGERSAAAAGAGSPATRPVELSAATQAAAPVSDLEAEYLDILQLQTAVQERWNQTMAEQRDADRKAAQCAKLAEEQARVERQLDRVGEEINALQLVMRSGDGAGICAISQAVGAPACSP